MEIILRPHPLWVDSVVGVHNVWGDENTVGQSVFNASDDVCGSRTGIEGNVRNIVAFYAGLKQPLYLSNQVDFVAKTNYAH